jgi:anti-sigma B factor antagonist
VCRYLVSSSVPPRSENTQGTARGSSLAPSLHERIDLLRISGHSVIVVDLLDATVLDSIALGFSSTRWSSVENLRGDLHLVVTEPCILRVLEITGLAKTFSIHSSHDELRNAVGGESKR